MPTRIGFNFAMAEVISPGTTILNGSGAQYDAVGSSSQEVSCARYLRLC